MIFDGMEIDVIEVFDSGYALVQSINDGRLFLVEFCDLAEYNNTDEDFNQEKSNIISIEDFKKCQRRAKTNKKKLV